MIVPVVFLVLWCSLVHSIFYRANFKISEFGFKFHPRDPNDLLMVKNDTRSRMFCVQQCLHDIRCRTVQYDSTWRQCSLYSAWKSEGTLLPSASTTSQITYIEQQASFYSSHLNYCVPALNNLNRYMQCINSSWTCPYRYFFNGQVCEYWRSFNEQCQTDQWCDSSTYLTCPSLIDRCVCNHSMIWSGSICNSCKSIHMH
jgi:hypothetical protein